MGISTNRIAPLGVRPHAVKTAVSLIISSIIYDNSDNNHKECNMPEKIFISELTVENFRSIRKMEARNFGQINIITGNNNAGKTAFLEALFLNLGPTNPTLWTRINAIRGLDRISPSQSTAPYLFNEMNMTTSILFSVKTKEGNIKNLSIRYYEPETSEFNGLSKDNEEGVSSETVMISDVEESKIVELAYESGHDAPRITRSIISPNRIQLQGDKTQVYYESVFISPDIKSDKDIDAKRYDLLNRENRIAEFECLLKVIEPDLLRTSLGIENEQTIIHADTGFGLMPLSLLGSGSLRLSKILLALVYSKGGVVLIDEVENSFHHSILPKVWSGIAEFIRGDDCQVFATTHSRECIEAAISVFEQNKSIDFRVHRIDKTGQISKLYTFDLEQIKVALETGWEMR